MFNSKIDKITCEHNFTYDKCIHKAKKEGVKDSFHYKAVCEICKFSKHVPRTKEIFELVKDLPWKLRTKKNKQNEKLQTLFGTY